MSEGSLISTQDQIANQYIISEAKSTAGTGGDPLFLTHQKWAQSEQASEHNEPMNYSIENNSQESRTLPDLDLQLVYSPNNNVSGYNQETGKKKIYM